MILTDISLMYIRGKNNNLFIYIYFIFNVKDYGKELLLISYTSDKREIQRTIYKVMFTENVDSYHLTNVFLHLLFIVHHTLCFSGTNQKPERRRPFETGLVRHCPQGLFWPYFTFLLCHIFPPV